jgi:hypothetical protein
MRILPAGGPGRGNLSGHYAAPVLRAMTEDMRIFHETLYYPG